MDIGKLLQKNTEELFKEADSIRRDNVGDIIHIRALLEISNICYRNCDYCGLRSDNKILTRYKMSLQDRPIEITLKSRKMFNTLIHSFT